MQPEHEKRALKEELEATRLGFQQSWRSRGLRWKSPGVGRCPRMVTVSDSDGKGSAGKGEDAEWTTERN